MKSSLTKQFRKKFARLPRDVQKQAREAYKIFKVNPFYPSLHFKCIDSQESIYSVRVGLHYRAVGTKEDDNITWYFIGTHEEYNNLV